LSEQNKDDSYEAPRYPNEGSVEDDDLGRKIKRINCDGDRQPTMTSTDNVLQENKCSDLGQVDADPEVTKYYFLFVFVFKFV
jgi:hypothetical protein